MRGAVERNSYYLAECIYQLVSESQLPHQIVNLTIQEAPPVGFRWRASYGEHGVVGFVGSWGERGSTTFKASITFQESFQCSDSVAAPCVCRLGVGFRVRDLRVGFGV